MLKDSLSHTSLALISSNKGLGQLFQTFCMAHGQMLNYEVQYEKRKQHAETSETSAKRKSSNPNLRTISHRHI